MPSMPADRGLGSGPRLAAISVGTHPDADQFIAEPVTEDSAVTRYLVAEVLNPQAARGPRRMCPRWPGHANSATLIDTGNEKAPVASAREG